MTLYVCTKKCFFNSCVINKGDERSYTGKEGVAADKFTHLKRKGAGVVTVEAPVEEPLTFAGLAKAEGKEEARVLYMKMTKDDLIAKAADEGLSKGRNLVALTVAQLVDLIVDKPKVDDTDDLFS